MTNGEMIQKVFNCEVCEPIPEDDIIHVIFPDKNDSAIGFDLSWWNMEYEEPTTKNDLGVDCIDRNSIKYYPGTGGYMYASKGEIDQLPSVTPQESRKGHWIVEKGGSYLGKRNGYCSNCKDFYTNDWNVMSFCPNCGADMSEVEE